MQTKWTWCCCGCPKCSACAGNEGPEMIWTHLKGMASTCTPHNRNLEMPYYGRALGGCGYTVKGEDPDTDSLFAIFPDGHAEFRSRQNAVPDLDYRYPDCAGGLQLDMDCVTWTDAGASWDCCPGVCDCTNGELEVLGVGSRQILDNGEGSILDEAGNPIVGIITSECGEAAPTPQLCSWCQAGTTPTQWRVVLQNFAFKAGPDGDGDHCVEANGTWILDRDDFDTNACRWVIPIPSPEPATIPDGYVHLFVGPLASTNTNYQVVVKTPSTIIGAQSRFDAQLDVLDPDCNAVQDLSLIADPLGSQCDLTTATCVISAIP